MYDSLARYYDHIHAQLTADVDFILQLLQERGGPVLEVGCGTGRLLIPVAAAGHRITGIDNAQAMLDRAHAKLSASTVNVQERVTLIQANILRLPENLTNLKVATVIVPYNTLFHFSQAELPQLFRVLAGLMKPDGMLFLDVANPFLIEEMVDGGEPSLEMEFLDDLTGDRVEQWSHTELDANAQKLRVTWSFKTGEDNSISTKLTMDYRYLFPHQLELLLQRAGFQLEQLLGDYEGLPFTEHSERLLVIAHFSR